MAKFFDNIKLKTASQSQLNKFDLSCQNLTTMDFYNIKPVYARELVPGTTHDVNVEVFTRLSPLVNPMLGQCRLVNRAFFVPYRTVWRPWTAFITDTKVQHGDMLFRPTKVPTITNDLLVQFLTVYANYGGEDSFDFWGYDGHGEYVRKRFNNTGQRYYDMFLNLGYSINFDTTDTSEYSALPLLCMARIVYDWLSNSQYENADVLLKYFELVNNDVITIEMLRDIMPLLFVLYHSDYFTSAFDNPNGPNITSSNISIRGEIREGYENEVRAESVHYGGTPRVLAGGPIDGPYANSQFTQFTLDALKFMTDYIKRLQFAGTRAIDRYFAKFGKRLDAAKLERCQYIGKSECNIQISDVMQTATDGDSGQGLGDYAGKGIAYGKGNFKYSTDEFGMFIILSYIEPRTSTVQGVDRSVLHLSKLDFFTPEFDSLSYQAISQNEFFADYKGHPGSFNSFKNQHSYQPGGVFGFTPRYSEYKVSLDKLTGNFRLGSLHNSLSPWHLYRMLHNSADWQSNDTDVTLYKHNYDLSKPGDKVYNRVFADSGVVSNVDHFFTLFNFDVTSYAPMHELYESYHFDGHGRDVNMQVNGTSLKD